jgi:hypothetical protein
MEKTNQTFQHYQNNNPNHPTLAEKLKTYDDNSYICDATRQACKDQAIAAYQNQINTQDGPAF